MEDAATPPEDAVAPSYELGSTIRFGDYDWRVLDVQNGRALILSDTVIERRAYHSQWAGITWAECDLRAYLNGEFYNKFNPSDKARIAGTDITTANNPWYRTKGGGATSDRIFLLSLEEVIKYFGDSGKLRKRPKDAYWIDDRYNRARVAKDGNGGASWWWLRAPGQKSYIAASVNVVGGLSVSGYDVVDDDGGVRPALWLNL
jgi:hypothetical protein